MKTQMLLLEYEVKICAKTSVDSFHRSPIGRVIWVPRAWLVNMQIKRHMTGARLT